jgi:hypothetical protein
MRCQTFAAAILALAASLTVSADCITDGNGKAVCGGGDCVPDVHGKVFCAKPGGGAVKDRYGNVLCGKGKCEQDSYGKVWCSKEAGGGAAPDGKGGVKCLSGCDEGTAEMCKEAE